MKTFKQLTVDDTLYFVYQCSVSIKKISVREVSGKYIIWGGGYDELLERTDLTYSKVLKEYVFSNEAEAIRYAKSNSIKAINDLISQAKNKINDIKRFREDHYENLNINWTDAQINLLEKAVNQ